MCVFLQSVDTLELDLTTHEHERKNLHARRWETDDLVPIYHNSLPKDIISMLVGARLGEQSLKSRLVFKSSCWVDGSKTDENFYAVSRDCS